MAFIYFYGLILLHPYLACWWMSFPAAGRQKWEALVPGYNYFVAFKIACNKPFWSLLLVVPGVHLIMLAVLNISYFRKFGYFSLVDSLQGIIFPYYLMYKIGSNGDPCVPETNWALEKDKAERAWSDHLILFLGLPVIGHVLTTLIGLFKKEKSGDKTLVKEWGDSIWFALIAAGIIRTYVFEPFQIPTGSMEKTLLVGDFLFVNKLAYGSKVPVTPLSYPLVHNTVPWINIKSYTTLEKGSYYRLPGFGDVNRNDVVVFNYPSGDTAVYDPRMPDGLMGHDYHGILNDEAKYYWTQENKATIEEIGRKYNYKFEYEARDKFIDSFSQDFMKNFSKWKEKARNGMKEGITYCRGGIPGSELNYIQHYGLIDRPVDKRENYIKRCVGIPKDWIEIKNSTLYINNQKAFVAPNQCLLYFVDQTTASFPSEEEMFEKYGLEAERGDFKSPENMDPNMQLSYQLNYNLDPNKKYYAFNITLSEKNKILKDFPKANFLIASSKKSSNPNSQSIENLSTFPNNFSVENTITDFQRFQVPYRGKIVDFSKENIAWYRRIITAYEGHKLEEKADGIYIDGKKTNTYTIEMNYYWLMGDNRYNSADSRIWGFVPEDHVVGRASLVWFSKSPYLGVRWDRILKWID
jgi:signal peptidase I